MFHSGSSGQILHFYFIFFLSYLLQYDFSGRKDIISFIKEIQAQGLYVSLRIGPFIEAEWTYGYTL